MQTLTEKDLLDVIGGYRLSAAVRAMAELGIPDLLAGTAQTTGELASALGVKPAPLDRLLRMLASRGALELDELGRYRNSGLSAALVRGEMRDLLLGWAMLPGVVAAWGSLAAAIRQGTTPFEQAHHADLHGYFDAHPDEYGSYVTAMGSTIDGFEAMADALDLSGDSTVVSVGGGQGMELVPLLRKWPQLRAVLTDFPEAVVGADELFVRFGLADRVRIVAGDARSLVPSGDAYVLSTVLRCLPDDDVVAVLTACRAAARPGARVHVVEMPIPDGGPQHPSATADLIAWVAYGGADRTVPQWTRLHAEAGWRVIGVTPANSPFAIISSEVAATP